MIKKIVQDKFKDTESVSIVTDQGELRVVFNTDGTFRLVTNLKVEQVFNILEANKDFGAFQKVVKVEDFSYPED